MPSSTESVVQSGVTAGHQIRAGFMYETESFAHYDSTAGISNSDLLPFGYDAQVGTGELSNAFQRVFEPGKRVAIDQLAMIFDGSFDVSFTLTNPWWIRAVLGEPDITDDGNGTYTYNYSSENQPGTFKIVEGHVPSKKMRVLLGCMVTQVTVDINAGEAVTVSVQGAYADERTVDTNEASYEGDFIQQPDLEEKALTFAEAVPVRIDGTTEAYVQSMSLNLTANVDAINEIGVRVSIDFSPKTLEPSVEFTKIKSADSEDVYETLEEAYGGSDSTSPEDTLDNKVSAEMEFDNGQAAGSGINQGTFTVSGTVIDSYGESGVGDATADLEETINRPGLDLEAEWQNESEIEAVI